jgi:hypothetical protein
MTRPVDATDLVRDVTAPFGVVAESRRASSALMLAAWITHRYPAVPLAGVHVHLLDATLPGLLERTGPGSVRALLALCAALSDRLSTTTARAVAPLASHPERSVALAARITRLLLERMYLSQPHLNDLAAVAGADVVLLSMSPRRTPRARAVSFVYAVAVAGMPEPVPT